MENIYTYTFTTKLNIQRRKKMQSYLNHLDEVETSVSRLKSFSALHNTLKTWSIHNADGGVSVIQALTLQAFTFQALFGQA